MASVLETHFRSPAQKVAYFLMGVGSALFITMFPYLTSCDENHGLTQAIGVNTEEPVRLVVVNGIPSSSLPCDAYLLLLIPAIGFSIALYIHVRSYVELRNRIEAKFFCMSGLLNILCVLFVGVFPIALALL